MPVYDVAANQVLAKPVSSFMQGRAMQIALQSEKLKNTAMEQEIGAFDAREARAERQLQVNEKTVDIAETNAEANLTRVMTDYQKHLRGLDADALEEQNRETTQAYSLFEDQGEEASLNFLKQNSTEEEFQQFIQMAEQVGGVGPLLKSSYEAIKGVVGGEEGSKDKATNIRLPDGTVVAGMERSGQLLLRDGTPAPEGTSIAGTTKSGTRMEINERTGKVLFIDEAGKTVKEVDISDAIDEVVDPENGGPSLFQLAELGTGLGSGIRAAWGSVPVIGELSPANQTEYARNQLTTSVQSLIKSLAVNPKYASTELERLRKEVAIEPSVFTTPTKLRARMVSINDYLVDELADNMKIYRNPNQSTEQREAAQQSINDIERFLDKMSVPQIVKTQDEVDKLSKGTMFLDSDYNLYRKD